MFSTKTGINKRKNLLTLPIIYKMLINRLYSYLSNRLYVDKDEKMFNSIVITLYARKEAKSYYSY